MPSSLMANFTNGMSDGKLSCYSETKERRASAITVLRWPALCAHWCCGGEELEVYAGSRQYCCLGDETKKGGRVEKPGVVVKSTELHGNWEDGCGGSADEAE